jgi:hypothetical protein
VRMRFIGISSIPARETPVFLRRAVHRVHEGKAGLPLLCTAEG